MERKITDWRNFPEFLSAAELTRKRLILRLKHRKEDFVREGTNLEEVNQDHLEGVLGNAKLIEELMRIKEFMLILPGKEVPYLSFDEEEKFSVGVKTVEINDRSYNHFGFWYCQGPQKVTPELLLKLSSGEDIDAVIGLGTKTKAEIFEMFEKFAGQRK